MEVETEDTTIVRCHACGTVRELNACPIVPRLTTRAVTRTLTRAERKDLVRACPNCMSSHLEPKEE